jgi:hypothetical protein
MMEKISNLLDDYAKCIVAKNYSQAVLIGLDLATIAKEMRDGKK